MPRFLRAEIRKGEVTGPATVLTIVINAKEGHRELLSPRGSPSLTGTASPWLQAPARAQTASRGRCPGPIRVNFSLHCFSLGLLLWWLSSAGGKWGEPVFWLLSNATFCLFHFLWKEGKLWAITGSHTVSTGNTSILWGTRYCLQRRKSLGNKKATALLLIFNGPLGEGQRVVFFPVGTLLSLGKLIKEAYCWGPFFTCWWLGPTPLGCFWQLPIKEPRERENHCRQSHHTPRAVEPRPGCSLQNEIRAVWGGLWGLHVCRICQLSKVSL